MNRFPEGQGRIVGRMTCARCERACLGEAFWIWLTESAAVVVCDKCRKVIEVSPLKNPPQQGVNRGKATQAAGGAS